LGRPARLCVYLSNALSVLVFVLSPGISWVERSPASGSVEPSGAPPRKIRVISEKNEINGEPLRTSWLGGAISARILCQGDDPSWCKGLCTYASTRRMESDPGAVIVLASYRQTCSASGSRSYSSYSLGQPASLSQPCSPFPLPQRSSSGPFFPLCSGISDAKPAATLAPMLWKDGSLRLTADGLAEGLFQHGPGFHFSHGYMTLAAGSGLGAIPRTREYCPLPTGGQVVRWADLQLRPWRSQLTTLPEPDDAYRA